MISVWRSYIMGMTSAWQDKKMILFLYFTNFFIAYLMILPLSAMFEKAIDNTTAALTLLESFNISIFSSIWWEYGKGINLFRLISTFGLIYLVINTFFAGGILHLINENLTFSFKEFFKGAATYFKRFIKLFSISFLFFLMMLLTYLILSGFSSFLTRNSVTEFWPVILFFIRILIVIMMAGLINMIFDYAKILTVTNDFHRMFKTVKDTMMFVLMSMRKTTGLYALYFLTSVLMLVVYLLFSNFISVQSPVTILIIFIFSQVYMLIKMFLRVCFFTGQYVFYKHSNTAMPGMTREMLDEAVAEYDKRKTNGEE